MSVEANGLSASMRVDRLSVPYDPAGDSRSAIGLTTDREPGSLQELGGKTLGYGSIHGEQHMRVIVRLLTIPENRLGGVQKAPETGEAAQRS